MSKLQIFRRPQRTALLISQGMTRESPGLLFPLQGIEPGELDELIRAILAKQGITDEATIQAIIEKAEQDSEMRLKVAEARAKVRKIMSVKKRGVSVMQRGHHNWVPAFFMGKR